MPLTKPRPVDLPDFREPPLVETVLALQFEPVSGLTSGHLGLLWQQFRQELPLIEEHPPLVPVVEEFGQRVAGKVDVRISAGAPTPRIWYLNEDNSELIQAQRDRFIHNWRKVQGSGQYPRYERIRDRFRQEANHFEQFLAAEHLPAIRVNQCEVTYVNHIEPGGHWTRHGELDSVFTVWSAMVKGSFLPEPEDVGIRARFVVPAESGKPAGRLHVVVQPAWKKTGSSPILVLNLTARGAPLGPGLDDAFAFLDLGREWIVKGFADLTTREMQKVWERIDV